MIGVFRMIWYWVDGDEWVVCWGSLVFSAVGGSVVGLSGYGGWFFVRLWFVFSFLVCKIGNRGGSSWVFYGWSFRYSFALLSNLKKSEASGVVRPVRVVLFLSG